MRAGRTVGLGVAAVLALALAATSSASVGAPEFGRCLKQATKSLSNYDNGKCLKTAGEDPGTEAEKLKKGNFQWFPGVVQSNFTLQVKEGTIVLFESVLGTKIACTGGTGGGAYTGTKSVGGIVIKFTKCETGGGQCNSAGEAAGKVTTNELVGTLGIWQTGATPAKDKPGISLTAASGEYLVQFECNGLKGSVRGAVIVPVPANAMKLSTTVKLAEAKGKQKPERFVEGPLEVLELSISGSPFEQVGLGLALIQTNEEKVAVSTVL